MANWTNSRLIVTGTATDVAAFTHLASSQPGALFAPDMLRGEGGDLVTDPVETVAPGLARQVYTFQIRNDDGQDHFCKVSVRFPGLRFVLVNADVNLDEYMSFLIVSGQAQTYEVPDALKETIVASHGVIDGSEDEFWDTVWALMDLAQAYWDAPQPSLGEVELPQP